MIMQLVHEGHCQLICRVVDFSACSWKTNENLIYNVTRNKNNLHLNTFFNWYDCVEPCRKRGSPVDHIATMVSPVLTPLVSMFHFVP